MIFKVRLLTFWVLQFRLIKNNKHNNISIWCKCFKFETTNKYGLDWKKGHGVVTSKGKVVCDALDTRLDLLPKLFFFPLLKGHWVVTSKRTIKVVCCIRKRVRFITHQDCFHYSLNLMWNWFSLVSMSFKLYCS